MAKPSTRELVEMARKAGYHVDEVEQLRPNRWLLTLTDGTGARVMLMIQARPLIGSSDVQDLAEIMRLRQAAGAILLAYGGDFTPAAQRTLTELGDARLRLCTTLPPAARQTGEEVHQIGTGLQSILYNTGPHE